jgi:hypothetical protein
MLFGENGINELDVNAEAGAQATTDEGSLERAHAKLVSILGADRTECFEAALAVEHLRHLWRPDHVRVVLLAESHVWTSRDEAKSRVIQPDGVETGFARFIYCLGGGEPQLVFPSVSPNVGASQYWTLLHDSVYGPDQSHQALLKSGEPKSSRRVANKLKLLHEMRSSGIWLVDASVAALYRAGDRLARGTAYESVLRTCWDSYVGAAVRAAAPDLIVVIGRQVADAIGHTVRRDLGADVRIDAVKQPNAHMSATERAQYRRRVFDLCRAR